MMRPVQRAGLEAGRVSAMMVMMYLRVVLNGCSSSRRTRGAEADRGSEIFRDVRFFPLCEKVNRMSVDADRWTGLT